jgi:hypothetical protein
MVFRHWWMLDIRELVDDLLVIVDFVAFVMRVKLMSGWFPAIARCEGFPSDARRHL